MEVFDETKKTDANGKIELTGLLDGVWYYQETASPEAICWTAHAGNLW